MAQLPPLDFVLAAGGGGPASPSSPFRPPLPFSAPVFPEFGVCVWMPGCSRHLFPAKLLWGGGMSWLDSSPFCRGGGSRSTLEMYLYLTPLPKTRLLHVASRMSNLDSALSVKIWGLCSLWVCFPPPPGSFFLLVCFFFSSSRHKGPSLLSRAAFVVKKGHLVNSWEPKVEKV